jgi:hypothetical protein
MGWPLPHLGYGLDVLPRRCADTFRLLDAVGARRREDDADVRQPEGVVRARQALDHHLRHRAALDDAMDAGAWLKVCGIGWRLREVYGDPQPCGQCEGQSSKHLA